MTTLYHSTTHENWKKIQDEGVLWGVRSDGGISRCTYLAFERANAVYGGKNSNGNVDALGWDIPEVTLAVHYPREVLPQREDQWQIREYEPIPLDWVEVLSVPAE